MRGMFLGLSLLAWSPLADAGSTSASSFLVDDDGVKHTAALAFDGQLTTGWAEGDLGVGEGAWLEVRFDRPVEVSSVSIWPGDLTKGTRSLKEHGRPHTVTVSLDVGGEEPVTAEARCRDAAELGPLRVDVPIEGKARSMRISLDQAYAGYIRNDTYIAEVAVNFVDGVNPPSVERLNTWRDSDAGKKAAEKHREAVIAEFDRIDQSEFGDRDAMAVLMGWAANGSPWLASRVKRDVAPGFRMQTLPPDDVALQALLKLKDANAIPAIEMASLRSRGKQQRTLASQAAYFRAYGDLVGGGRRSIDIWGESGWEKGALEGLGEPLSIGMGEYGDIYVSDTANNRVQAFGPDGAVRLVIGASSPVVSNEWFGKRRDWYVAGSGAAEEDARFVNPVDLVVHGSKGGEVIAVLDSSGRLQRFSDAGAFLGSSEVGAETGISPGVSGEGHVVRHKKGYAVVWGNEVFLIDDAGEVSEPWRIEDGVPMTATMVGSKLLLGFRGEAVSYTVDGFRLGTTLKSELPRGWEAFDLVLDDRNKLWAITDNGWAIKYKKPGKIDFQVRFVDYPIDVPRAVVQDDFLFVSTNGKILQFDALEKLEEAEASE